jgi:hypothetical protein
VAEGVPQDLPGFLAEHLLAVVDGTGALLHQQPGAAAGQGAGAVGVEGGVGGGAQAWRGRVLVGGDDVEFAGEGPQVHVLVGGEHQVEGGQADPGPAHELVVLLPDRLVPLLGVVVPAEGEAAQAVGDPACRHDGSSGGESRWYLTVGQHACEDGVSKRFTSWGS